MDRTDTATEQRVGRRDYLTLLGGTAAAGIAGCLGNDSTGNGDRVGKDEDRTGRVPHDELPDGYDGILQAFDGIFDDSVAAYNDAKRGTPPREFYTDIFDEDVDVAFFYNEDADGKEDRYDLHIEVDTNEQGAYADISSFMDSDETRTYLRNDVVRFAPWAVYTTFITNTTDKLQDRDAYQTAFGGLNLTIHDANDNQIVTDLSADAYREAEQTITAIQDEYDEGTAFRVMDTLAREIVLPNTEPAFEAPKYPRGWNV